MSRIKSGHMVNLINVKTLTKDVVSLLIGCGFDLNRCEIKPFSRLGIVTDINGEHYIINDEGCYEGSGKSIEENRANIVWYKNEIDKEGNITSMGISPFVEIALDLDEIKSYLTKEFVPLDEFVRVFGDRLDSNVRTWDRFLDNPEKEN